MISSGTFSVRRQAGVEIFFAAFTPHFVFSLTGAAKKHIIGEKPLDKQAVFQGRWGGIGGDRVQSENL